MFRRSGNRIGVGALTLVLMAVAGCSTSGSRPIERTEGQALQPVSTPADRGEPTDAGVTASPGLIAGPLAPPVEVPERAMAGFTRAVNAMSAADWIEAELEFKQLILEYPSFPGPYINLSIIYRRDGRVDDAEAALRQALAIAPGHPIANQELGVLHRERGEFAEAEAAYRQAIESNPAYALAHYNLGVLFDLYLKREADALNHYETYLSLLAEPDAEVRRWVIDLRRRLGLPAEPVQVAQETGP